MQRDFFLESSVVGGGKMGVDYNLHDPMQAGVPRFLLSFRRDATDHLPHPDRTGPDEALRDSPNTDMATAITTAAYLCGYGELLGEAMHWAAAMRPHPTWPTSSPPNWPQKEGAHL